MPVAINAITSTAGSGNLSPRTDGWGLPAGTNGQRLLGTSGAIRFNTTSSVIEGTMDGVTYVTIASAVGPILSVSGTANRITVSAGVNPVVDISAAYIGQASITTLGTITSGVWNAGNVTTAQMDGGNIRISANNITALNVNGSLNLIPNGLGQIILATTTSIISGNRFVFSNAGNTFATSFRSGASLANVDFVLPIADATSAGMPLISDAATNMSFGVATVPGGGTGIATTTAYGVIVGGTTATGAFQNAGAGTAGQVLVSNGAAAVPSFQTFPSFSWIDQAATPVAMVANQSYSANTGGLLTFNMPAVAAFGTIFEVVGEGAGGWLIQFAGGQTGHLNSTATTVAGSFASTNRRDAIKLLCTVANTTFVAISSSGAITNA